MASPSSRLVAAAARARLSPLGLRQRGRSRVWLDDRGWWLGVVEFPSPSWSQGSGLHVGAMWLWQDVGHLAYDVGERLCAGEDFRDETQFAKVAEDLAGRAEARVRELRDQFATVRAAANHLSARPVRRGQFWEPWNAGVAAGLVGDTATAGERFGAVLAEEPLADWMRDGQRMAAELAALLGDAVAFRAWVADRVTSCRQRLGLGPAEDLAGSLGAA